MNDTLPRKIEVGLGVDYDQGGFSPGALAVCGLELPYVFVRHYAGYGMNYGWVRHAITYSITAWPEGKCTPPLNPDITSPHFTCRV